MTTGATCVAGLWAGLGLGLGVPAADGPIILENEHIAVHFDPTTGAWTHLIDKASGINLIQEPAASVPADLVAWLDVPRIEAAIADKKAVSIEGAWRYAPEPAKKADEATLASAGFDDRKWKPTPVPSRADTGDRQLKDRLGAFWYRTSVKIPANWAGHDLAIIIGAVDDFDTTFFNGRRVGATLEDTPRHWEIPRRYILPATNVRFGESNTVAIRVVNAAFSGGIAGPVCVGLADAMPASEPGVSLVSHRRSENGDTLILSLRYGPFLIHAAHTLHPATSILSRRFTIENVGSRTEVLCGAGCILPELSPGAGTAAICPDALPVGDQQIATLPAGHTIRPSSQDGLVYLWSAEAKLGVGSWFYGEDEYAPVAVARRERGTRVVYNVAVSARIEPGRSVQLGTQFIWLAGGSRDGLLRSVQSVFKIVDLHAPAGGLDRLRERILYCGHPGGMPEQKYRGYGGFKALQGYLPTLRKMGVDVLWMLPIFEHGDGQKWNLYSPFDQFKISPLYGTPAELKSLAAAGRAAGVDLVFDLVPHGPPDDTPLGKAHPDWVCLDEAGKPIHVWGQLAFDNANPGWQDYLRKVAEQHAREYGVVGVRVDVAAGSPANWDPRVGYRASHSTLGGGLGMDRAIREGLAGVHPGVLLLPEEYTGCRVFYLDADLTYDAQLFFLMVDLQARKATPPQWAKALQEFLHDQSLTLPPGALKMRWTANHDTVSWTFQKKRTREAYGFERARALLALCCLIDGVPMIYQGEEDPTLYGGKGESIVDFIAQIVACRKRLPALSRGTADYAAVRATGGVFACLRADGDQRAIVLVSLNPKPATSRLTLPAELWAVKRWKDDLSGETHSASSVPMGNHQVRVLVPAE